MDVPKLKGQMRAYALKHGLKVPRVMWRSQVWGIGARTLAWRVSGHYGKPTTSADALWRHFNPSAKPHIIQHDWDWNGSLGKRFGNPRYIVWHNSGSTGGTIEGFHAYHQSLGWLGVAYMYVIYKNGDIHEGRPEWAMGGHTYMAGDTIGVCCVGNYESSDRVMPAAQLASAKALHGYLHGKYKCPDRRHKDMPQNSTGCPGKYYPFAAITG